MDYLTTKIGRNGSLADPKKQEILANKIAVTGKALSFCMTQDYRISVPAVRLLTILSKTGGMSESFDSIISDNPDVIKQLKKQAIELGFIKNGIVPEDKRKILKAFLTENDNREEIYTKVELELEKLEKARSR